MVDKKAVKKYHIRRDGRLKKRGIRLDTDWEEEKHPRDENGRFAPGSSGGSAPKKVVPVKLRIVKNSGKFADRISKAKKSLGREDGPWRVTAYAGGEEFDSEHPGAKKFTSDGGSTIAVTGDGDIVGVCRMAGDSVRGKQLIEYAVKNGGNKLDAYEGLFGFYTKCGFEPVSWCKWDEQYAPPDWRKGEDQPENIVFYKYTGNKSQYTDVDDFFAKVEASEDYDVAKNVRDKEVRK